MKSKFIEDLKNTGRNGIDQLLEFLEEIDFYEKPASIKHHLNKTGGLLEHTVNVKNEYLKLNEESGAGIPWKNIVIQASLHDLEKCFAYTSEMQNTITDGQNDFLKKLANSNTSLYKNYEISRFVRDKNFIISKEYASELIGWFKAGNDIAPPEVGNSWNYNQDNLPVNHSMRSIIEASKFIDLEERDNLAILYHMGPYSNLDEKKRGREIELYPDVKLLHLADLTATTKEDIEEIS